jgi:biopolymer transport protein ExbD
MRKSFVDHSQRRSPLKEMLRLKGTKKSGVGREMAIALPLTSLIDAFSIIVIYLLIGTQGGGIESKIPTSFNLPLAQYSQTLTEETPILRIEKGRYFLNDEAISLSDLGPKLQKIQAQQKSDLPIKKALMVQADIEMKYADLDPLLKAGSQAGIEQLKFAVVPTR